MKTNERRTSSRRTQSLRSIGLHPHAAREGGFLLVTVLLVTVVLGILIIGTSTTSLIDRQVASRQRGGTEAHYLAQAGLDRLKTALFLALSDYQGQDAVFCGPPEDLEIDLGSGFVLASGDTSEPIADFSATGFYQLHFDRRQGFFILTSVGWLGSEDDRVAQATVQLVATAGVEPFGPYDNAIFTKQLTTGAAAGQTGTIAAYGSVHVVNGEVDLTEDGIAVTYTGTSGIYNNYNGRAEGEASNVVPHATKTLGLDRAYPFDLCSRLKVQQGDVRVGSNAAGIGAAGDTYDEDGEWEAPWNNPDAGPQIQSIEGVYLGAGNVVYQGQQRQIYSRSGVLDAERYGELHLDFPELPLGFPSEDDGPSQVVLDSSNCALIDEDGVLAIPPREPLDVDAISCPADTSGDNFLTWDESRKVLVISGTIALPDTVLSIQPRLEEEGVVGAEDVVTELVFEGLGQFRVGTKVSEDDGEGRIEVGMEVLPEDPDKNYCVVRPGEGEEGDPVLCGDAHGLVFVTAGDIDFAGVTGAEATVSGLFYAEGSINLPHQVAVVGSIVGGNVHVQQVPRVLWHPDIVVLAEAMGMPGWELEFPGQWAEVSTEIR
jgi:hypothetical protein